MTIFRARDAVLSKRKKIRTPVDRGDTVAQRLGTRCEMTVVQLRKENLFRKAFIIAISSPTSSQV